MEVPTPNLGVPKPAHAGQSDNLRPVFQYLTTIAELGVIKFFIDYKIFDAIPDSDAISFTDLAASTGVELTLLKRFTNLLLSVGILTSPSPGYIALTAISTSYRSQSPAAMVFLHSFDFVLVPVAQWPKYFADHGPKEPHQVNQAPVSMAFGQPDVPFYQLLETMPAHAARFNATMAVAAAAMPAVGSYDFGWVADVAETDNVEKASRRPLIVDVGGGKGQALKAILAENPRIPAMRCVLMDREDVIEEAVKEDDEELRAVRKVPGDFHKGQPVKDAVIYHIRRVLNDWPDDNVVSILKHVRAACEPDSKVLISEQLLLDPPTAFNAVSDICLINFAGKRRSVQMYSDIAAKSGLKVSGVFPDEKSDTAVLELAPI